MARRSRNLVVLGTLYTTFAASYCFSPSWYLKAAGIWLLALHLFLTSEASLVVLGLLLSSAGDVLLFLDDSSPKPEYFIGGLGSFLLAHVAYAAAFWYGTMPRPALHPTSISVMLPRFAVLLAGLLVVLVPRIPEADLVVPVVIYGTAITAMCFLALNKMLTRASASAWLGFVGAAVFMLSDVLLAVNRFVAPLPYAHALVMSTYYAAQFAIAASAT